MKIHNFVRIAAYCCWYIGSPTLWFYLSNPFDRDLYNVDPYLWREEHSSLAYGLVSCLLFAVWLFAPFIVRACY